MRYRLVRLLLLLLAAVVGASVCAGLGSRLGLGDVGLNVAILAGGVVTALVVGFFYQRIAHRYGRCPRCQVSAHPTANRFHLKNSHHTLPPLPDAPAPSTESQPVAPSEAGRIERLGDSWALGPGMGKRSRRVHQTFTNPADTLIEAGPETDPRR